MIPRRVIGALMPIFIIGTAFAVSLSVAWLVSPEEDAPSREGGPSGLCPAAPTAPTLRLPYIQDSLQNVSKRTPFPLLVPSDAAGLSPVLVVTWIENRSPWTNETNVTTVGLAYAPLRFLEYMQDQHGASTTDALVWGGLRLTEYSTALDPEFAINRLYSGEFYDVNNTGGLNRSIPRPEGAWSPRHTILKEVSVNGFPGLVKEDRDIYLCVSRQPSPPVLSYVYWAGNGGLYWLEVLLPAPEALEIARSLVPL